MLAIFIATLASRSLAWALTPFCYFHLFPFHPGLPSHLGPIPQTASSRRWRSTSARSTRASFGVDVFVGAWILNSLVRPYADWLVPVCYAPPVDYFGEPHLGKLKNLVLSRAFGRFCSAMTVVHTRYPPLAVAAVCPQDCAAPGGLQLHTGPNKIGIKVGLALVEALQFTRQVNA